MFLQIVCFDPKHSLPLSIFTFPLPTEHSSFASMSFNSSIPTLVFKPSPPYFSFTKQRDNEIKFPKFT